MSPRKMGPKGWEVEDNTAAPSTVSDKDAAKVGEYRRLEKECQRLFDANESLEKVKAEFEIAVAGYLDKIAQVEELGYTFNESGVLIAPEVEAKPDASEGEDRVTTEAAPDDPARP